MPSGVSESSSGSSRREVDLVPVEAADEFERELLEVSALLASTVDRRRNQLHRDSMVDVIDTHEDAVETAARLVTGAAEHVDVVLAAEPAYSEAVHGALTALLSGTGRKTSRVRLLCTPSTLDWRFVSAHAAEPRVRTRVARIPALVAVIADNEHALVCAASVSGRRASVVRAPGVIQPLVALFDGVWRNAVEVSDRIEFGDKTRADIAQQILERLRAGVTDEVAARELTMSVRTYRRYVAEIMALLGANSRFQAGVRAAELGLLISQSAGERR